VISRPQKTAAPALTVSCPAIMRSVEVLPQPEGPSRQQYVRRFMICARIETSSAETGVFVPGYHLEALEFRAAGRPRTSLPSPRN
jgi:hypothetical protein